MPPATPAGCALHRWSPWRPVATGLLERRCPCGSVERGTSEAINAQALEQLDVVLAAFRRAFPGREVPHE